MTASWLARQPAGDPLALAGLGGDAAVERRRQLERDERPPLAHAQEEPGIELGRLLGAQPSLDDDAGGAQLGDALAGDARIGILDRYDDADEPGGDQGVGAGRRPAPMAARLEADIGGGAAGSRAGAGQRLGLAMRPAARLGPAAPDDAAVPDDDAADRRVGPDLAEAAPRQRDRRAHMGDVGHRGHRYAVNRCRR